MVTWNVVNNNTYSGLSEGRFFSSVDYSVHTRSVQVQVQGRFIKKHIVDTFYGFVTVRAGRQNSRRQRSET